VKSRFLHAERLSKAFYVKIKFIISCLHLFFKLIAPVSGGRKKWWKRERIRKIGSSCMRPSRAPLAHKTNFTSQRAD